MRFSWCSAAAFTFRPKFSTTKHHRRSGFRRRDRLSPPRRELPAELGLTDRQVEVLALMMQGKSNKMIAHLLDMAEPTVKNHVTAILKTLKVTNRTEAVIKVGNTGWESFPTNGS